jgi:cell division protein FtsB
VRAILIIVALVGISVIYAICDPDSGLRTWWRMRSELAVAHDRNAALRVEIEQMGGEIERLGDDRFAIERAIREDLQLARPGETIVRTVPAYDSTTRFP